MIRENRHFNRLEKGDQHKYYDELPNEGFGDIQYSGFIKCKLVHTKTNSLIIPDQVYVQEKEDIFWIQPLFFSPNTLGELDDDIDCRIDVDISCGHKLRIQFLNSGFLNRFQDGSEFYSCKILGPADLRDYSTGSCCMMKANEPSLQLYHHTSEEAKEKILDCGFFKPSSWNIQGSKRLDNVGYVYFTCLNIVKADEDLHQIAMAANEKLGFRVDDNFTDQPDLILKVYRESTLNRRYSISSFINADILAPQHIYLHRTPPNDFPVYYQIVSPFIYRVGIQPNTILPFKNERIIPQNNSLKGFDYMILGDASTSEGLKAPYDEENTRHVFIVERTEKEKSILEFWFNNSNQDHYSNKNTEFQKFKNEEH